MRAKYNEFHYHVMLIPAIGFLLVFNIWPLCYNLVAFKYFNPVQGLWASPWAGLEHFKTIFAIPEFYNVIFNTVYLSVLKIIFHLIIPLIFALMLNEVRVRWYKKSIQTIVYMPYFLSWVILAGIFKDIFSTQGIINGLLGRYFHIQPVMFFANNVWFPIIIVFTDIWKNFGFNAIVYLAALSNIDPTLYEVAEVDGASRSKQLRHITLPLLKPTVILLAALSLQGILNAGFDQIFNMYNPLVYKSADVLDTYIFRMGFQDSQFEFSTAVGLFKSVISFIFIVAASKLAKKYANYRIF